MKNIPKILHMYWDKSPMSWLQSLTPISFHKYNPDWTINVYTPKQVYTGDSKYIPDYTGPDYFHELPYVNIIEIDLKNYSIDPTLHDILRSDILRYHLLYDHGGVWSDFDVLWLNPIENLSEKEFNVTICSYNSPNGKLHYPIGILISVPTHSFYKTIINKCNLMQKGDRVGHQRYGSSMLSNLFPSINKTLKKYPDMIKIEYSKFYPYPLHDIKTLWDATNESLITSKVMCIHWFNGHKLSKQYINNNLVENCSMTSILKKENYI